MRQSSWAKTFIVWEKLSERRKISLSRDRRKEQKQIKVMVAGERPNLRARPASRAGGGPRVRRASPAP